MAARHIWAAGAMLMAAVAWAVALVIDHAPWSESAAGVLAAGLLVVIAVAVVAIMIDSSRLGYWLGVSGVGLMLALAGMRELDTIWVIAIALTAVAGVLMADRRLGGWIRTEGPVAPVPSRATGLGLLLLLAPILTAFFLINESGGGPIVWLTLASWGILVAFVRRLPGAVAAVRLGAPALMGASAFLDLPGTTIWGSLMLAASVLAWSKEVRLAVRPLVERGSRVSIPPELLSDDLRRAAGIDRDRE